MNIQDMKAGPELDRLVAEKVMGWTMTPTPGKYRGQCINEHGQPVLELINGGHGCDIPDELIFQPSTNITHVWEVVEKLTNNGKCLSLHASDGGYWTAYFVFHGWSGMAKDCASAPLAICLAALKAVT